MKGLVLLILIFAAVPQATVQQKTGGWCSPPIANVQGNVTVICNGVDPKALARLNAELATSKEELTAKIREANEWAEKYFKLERRLSEAKDDSQLSNEAAEYLHEGELDKAEAILDGLLKRGEDQVERVAANHFNMALILDLQFQPRPALEHFEKAYRYRPDNVEYGHQYARALEGLNRSEDAADVYRQNLPRIRELAKDNPNVYLPLAAKTLRNLGYLYLNLGKTNDAKAAYSESAELYLKLANTDPPVYLLLRAAALEGLGSVYEKSGTLEEAERYYHDSLDAFKRSGAQFGGAYDIDAAMLLDHLGSHYAKIQNTSDAEAMYNAVLTTGRRMAESNPGYGWVVALAFGHLGDLYHRLHRPSLP